MKKIIALISVFLPFSVEAADLYSALGEVYYKNPEILMEREAVNASKADVKLAKTGWQPSLGVQTGVDAARTELHKDNYHYTQKQIGIQASQNIFDGFSTTAQIKAAKNKLKAEESVLYATEQNVFLGAINAYIEVLNAKEILDLEKNNQKVLQELYNQYSQKATVGVLTKTDVAQAEARLEGAKYRVANAQAQYDNAIETYLRIYGKTEKIYQEINLKHLQTAFPKSLSNAEKTALSSHPAIISANADYEAAKENITVSKKSLAPSIDIKASAVRYDDVPMFHDASDERIGIYLTVPLYDRGIASAKTAKSKADAAATKEKITYTERVVLERLRQAWNIYEARSIAISSATAQIKAAKLALDGIKDEQEHGRRTVLDVLNVEQDLLDAKVALSRAKHSKISAFFAVLSGTGKLSADLLLKKH